jgi:hypothetical protein
MKNLLTLNYWFAIRPESLVPMADKIFLAVIALLLISTIAFAFLRNKPGIYRGFAKKFYTFSFSNSIIGLLLYFFNYEAAPFLSSRFWLALWLIGMAAWKISILSHLKDIPGQKKKLEQEKEFNKYLPK